MAKNYPVNLILENKKCLVVGAGSVAERKARRLLECGAIVSVVSPEISPGLKVLSENKKIIFKNKEADIKDLKGFYLVIAASSNRRLNSALSSYCLKKGILINVVDKPSECGFTLPSVLRRGSLTISVSTDGVSPALAKKIREDLEARFGNEYAGLLRMLGRIRPQAIKKIKKLSARRAFFQKTFQPDVLTLLKSGKEEEAGEIIRKCFANAYK